jgi:glycosyltransferase involved in cell wall biosynthesis
VSATREEPTICVTCLAGDADVRETLSSVLAYTSPEVPIIVAGVGTARLGDVCADLAAGRALEVLAFDAGVGFAEIANAASAEVTGDLTLVAAGVRVGPEWLERMRAAAHCDSIVVSATALGADAGALSVLAAHGLEGAELAQPDAALAVIARSRRSYPRISCAGHHCVYLRRALFDRLSGFDPALTDAAVAMAALSRHAVELGMAHVAADDVYVAQVPRAIEQIPEGKGDACTPVDLARGNVAGSPPRLSAVDGLEDRSVLRRSLASARVALHGMSVTIDARAVVGGGVGGTQLYAVELILALAAGSELRLRAVVPPDLPADVADRFAQLPELEVITYEQAVAGVRPSDVVHRPQQVFTVDDLALLQMLGERIVVGQQDLIAYRNPAYHESIERWLGYRRTTRLALAAADRVALFSEHAMNDVLAEDLIDRGRCDIVGIGADGLARAAPAQVPGVPPDRDLLVCIGADYLHKNRPFALALLQALRTRHGWDGILVLAGGRVSHGSSREEEEAFMADHPGLIDFVIDVGVVDEGQKAWLYERARAVVYPTLYEGFGLVPFEAAMSGAPCLFAPQAALGELAGPDAATLVPWDAQLSSDAVAPLLVDGPARERHLRLLLEGVERASWSGVVERLHATYERTIDAPYRASAPHAWLELERERFIASLETVADEYQQAYHELRANVGPGLPLVAEGGLLSRDEQRGLMRIASRRALHGLMLKPVGLLGRIGAQTAGAADASPASGAAGGADTAQEGRDAGPR